MADPVTFIILRFLALFLLQSYMSSLSMHAKILNITTDQYALIALKTHISFDPLHILRNNWFSNTSVCNWVGVTCGSRHHRVIALNLSDNGLIGTIPPHIGNLSFLVSLSIWNNSFKGSMPNELSHLYSLKLLDFGYNEFSGEIPSWIGLLTKLQILSLGTNNFEGTIPSSLFNGTSSLQQIGLGGNQLWGSIPSSILKMSNLKGISLAQNKFSGPMPSILFNLSSLHYIDLRNNTLSGALQPEVGNLTLLTDLYLDNNNFEGNLPSSLFNCKQLQFLYMRSNNFEGKLSPEIGNLTKLTALSLTYNNFEGAIPSEIGRLQSLEFLNLGVNNFVGTIPSEIFNISKIKRLGLALNYLSGNLPSDMGLFLPNLIVILLGVNELSGMIPTSISNASQLISVELVGNSFSGLIPNIFGNLRLLQVLNLGQNNLTIESPELSIFSYFSNNAYLRILDLSSNPLNGVLPNSIGNLSIFLKELDLTSCNIMGKIPIDIGNSSRLDSLYLGNNELAGTIPTTIGRLSMLEGLELYGNRLNRQVPSNICYFGKLVTLYLSANKLSGPIPECINNMTSLRYLYLDFNQLTSRLPTSLWRQTNLLEIDLSSNSISGSLPLDIENKVLTTLNLSRNKLSGHIPETIGGLKSLVNLSLAINQLEGYIPVSFGGLVSLELLDLVGNNLSGEIPKSLEVLRQLKYLNVSYNKLQGEIPTQGPFVNFSAESFMSNHALCGAIRLNVPPCKEATLRPRKATGTRILKYVLPPLGLMILVVSLVLVSKKLHGKKNAKLANNTDSIPLSTWRRVSHQHLLQAAEGFGANNLIGEGSFGSVYKGTFLDGTCVAIKVLNLEVEGAFKSFDIECEILRHIRHRNLVKIISVCSNIDFKALVLEYMPKGNLEMWLYSNTQCLNLLERLNIMIDVAAALEYLHLGYSTPIVHCDLKPSNVLLDEDMVGHVADFGIAKLLSDGISLTQTMTMATIGYMAPEYGSEGIVSTRGDVYSYGILLMETFTRKKPIDDMFIGEMSLKCLVEESIVSHSIIEVIDANLLSNENDYAAMETCLSAIMGLALHCCADLSELRIDMKNVLARLNKIKLKFLHDHGGG